MNLMLPDCRKHTFRQDVLLIFNGYIFFWAKRPAIFVGRQGAAVSTKTGTSSLSERLSGLDIH